MPSCCHLYSRSQMILENDLDHRMGSEVEVPLVKMSGLLETAKEEEVRTCHISLK